jgi:hypothetical protein
MRTASAGCPSSRRGMSWLRRRSGLHSAGALAHVKAALLRRRFAALTCAIRSPVMQALIGATYRVLTCG